MDENIQIKHIVVKAKCMANIVDCIKDSIRLSLDMDSDVVLCHNDNEYHIVMDDIVNAIWHAKPNKKCKL